MRINVGFLVCAATSLLESHNAEEKKVHDGESVNFVLTLTDGTFIKQLETHHSKAVNLLNAISTDTGGGSGTRWKAIERQYAPTATYSHTLMTLNYDTNSVLIATKVTLNLGAVPAYNIDTANEVLKIILPASLVQGANEAVTSTGQWIIKNTDGEGGASCGFLH